MKTLSILLSLLLCAVGPLPGRAAESPPAPVAIAPLVADLVARHPERRHYLAEIDAAKAQRRSAAAPADPELSLEVGRKRVRDSWGALAGEGTAWSVSVAQTFDWPGRVGLRKAIANRQVELAELGLARFEHALASRIRTLAHRVLAAQERAAAVREVADRFAELKETFLAREPAGITPLLETRVIEAAELALQRRADDAVIALQAARIELNQLRGASTDTPLPIAPARLKFHPAPPAAELLAAARSRNFDFQMRRVEFEQQGVVLELARQERTPAVTVSPYYSQESAGERERTVGLGVSLPLPIGGRTRAGAEIAEARRRQAETALQVAWRELEREILTSAHAFATRLTTLQAHPSDEREKFREAAGLADRHYRLGAVPVTTYVELQHSYLEAVEARLETEQDALAAGLRLQQLTGLDFPAVTLAP